MNNESKGLIFTPVRDMTSLRRSLKAGRLIETRLKSPCPEIKEIREQISTGVGARWVDGFKQDVFTSKITQAGANRVFTFDLGDNRALAVEPGIADEQTPTSVTLAVCEELIATLVSLKENWLDVTGIPKPSIIDKVSRVVTPDQIIRFVSLVELEVMEGDYEHLVGEEGRRFAEENTNINHRMLNVLARRAGIIKQLEWPEV